MDSKDLEGGLEAAYRKKRRGDSILATIERLTGAVPRVLLRDDADLPAPLVKPGDAPGSDRYQVIGEIGRGGVGVVLKGRDIDLGRDVAMKVLREGHADNPEIIQRFVEEAQIGGQLQHPGIVPVYELGLNAHKQPFFTMKLVKGQTLSALLTKRASVQEGRRKFLRVFEQVCETMAYAHTRGVIHRDLKPANIMVGAFGEVQIVDWGFAKILRSGGVDDERRAKQQAPDTTVVETVRSGSVGSESRAGSVMGTPAYMPPEQAMGEIEKLDERSDVFALGAILCEILTGKPPYVEGDKQLLVQAAEAKLDSVYARLDTCGADADLVQIAKRCLAPAPPVRYKDAGELVGVVGAHLAAIAERAQTADREAAVARAKAAEERKRRRLTVALAAAVVCAVVTTGVGLYWVDREQRRSLELALIPVQDAKDAALLAHGEARSDLSKWEAAYEAASRLVASAKVTDGADIDQARALLEQVRTDRRRAEEAAKAAARDQRLVERLEEIYTWRGGDFEEGAQAKAYLKALDGLQLNDTIRLEVVAAYDDQEQFDTASNLDPDPWRVKVRMAEVGKLNDLPTKDRSPRDLLLLAERLARGGETAAARKLLRQAGERAPRDFRIAFAAGWWDDTRARAESFRSAAFLRPRSIGVEYAWGVALKDSKQARSALARFQSVFSRDPEFANVRGKYSELLIAVSIGESVHSKQSAVAMLMIAIEADPANWKAHYRLGSADCNAGDPAVRDRGLSALREAHRLAPQQESAASSLVIWLSRFGYEDEALRVAESWVAREPEPGWHALASLYNAYRALGERDKALSALARRWDLVGRGAPLDSYFEGSMAYAAGDYAEAVGLLTESQRYALGQDQNMISIAIPHVYRVRDAVAHAKKTLGDHEGATHQLRELVEHEKKRGKKKVIHKALLAWWMAISPHDELNGATEAVGLIDACLAEYSNPHESLVVIRGVVNARFGNAQTAVDSLKSIREMRFTPNGTTAQWRCYLAIAYHRLGRTAEAKAQLKEVADFLSAYLNYPLEGIHLFTAYDRANALIGE